MIFCLGTIDANGSDQESPNPVLKEPRSPTMKISCIAKTVTIAAFGILAIAPVVGRAASIIPFLTNPVNPSPPPSNVNTFQDTDVERILRPDGAGGFTVVTSGQLQVNDIIETAAVWDSVNGGSVAATVGNFTYDLMAYSRIRIAAIANCVGTLCDLTFASGFADGQTAAQVFEADPGPLALQPFSAASAGGTAASQIAAITTGTSLLFAAGFGQADDFWTSADAETNLNLFAGLPSSSQVGVGNFGLSQIGPGLIVVEDNLIPATDLITGLTTLHAFGGNTSVFGLEVNTITDWLVSSNTTVKFATVPEPGTIGLIGLALAAAGVATRRATRQRKEGLV